MSRYFFNEGSFDSLDLDLRFEDKTIHVLALGGGARLFLDRGALRDGATAQDLAQARSEHEASRLAKFTVLAEREGTLGDVATFEVAARFRDELDLVYQRRTHFIRQGHAFAFTLRGPLSARDELDARMDGVLETLRFRGQA
ncbi:MAG: DcrB-related protein [Byssovorax sp.]